MGEALEWPYDFPEQWMHVRDNVVPSYGHCELEKYAGYAIHQGRVYGILPGVIRRPERTWTGGYRTEPIEAPPELIEEWLKHHQEKVDWTAANPGKTGAIGPMSSYKPPKAA
jgi:hypothetical protein